MSTHKIICGKSEIELKQFDDDSFDSCVCDPPYELNFMNRKWDNLGISFKVELWEEVYRVMKPGGHILVFGGDRTEHRMKCAVEDAGFEIRGTIVWIYGSGFPKSLDISKSLEGVLGKQGKGFVTAGDDGRKAGFRQDLKYRSDYGYEYNPTTEEAIQWNGWGTGLKPAVELICMARKPISERNIAANVLKWGVGGLNIGECRIQHNELIKETNRDSRGASWNNDNCGFRNEQNKLASASPQGRFPANLILSHTEDCEEFYRLKDNIPSEIKKEILEYYGKATKY